MKREWERGKEKNDTGWVKGMRNSTVGAEKEKSHKSPFWRDTKAEQS